MTMKSVRQSSMYLLEIDSIGEGSMYPKSVWIWAFYIIVCVHLCLQGGVTYNLYTELENNLS